MHFAYASPAADLYRRGTADLSRWGTAARHSRPITSHPRIGSYADVNHRACHTNVNSDTSPAGIRCFHPRDDPAYERYARSVGRREIERRRRHRF